MDRAKYIMIQVSMTPEEFIFAYNLKDKVHNRYIFKLVSKGMYGITQAGQITYDVLVQHVAPYVYQPSRKAWHFGQTGVAQLIPDMQRTNMQR